MELFSARVGLGGAQGEPSERLSEGLRNRLWNLIRSCCLDLAAWAPELNAFIECLWDEYFKRPVDRLPYRTVLNDLREYFFRAHWYEVYDFLEFCANRFPDAARRARLIAQANRVLEQERSPYRFVNGSLMPLDGSQEAPEVCQAVESTRTLAAVHRELAEALRGLQDRHQRDYGDCLEHLLCAVALLRDSLSAESRPMVSRLASVLEAVGAALAGTEGPRPHPRPVSFEEAKLAVVLCSTLLNCLLPRALPAERAALPVDRLRVL